MLARLARVVLVVTLLAGWQLALLHPLQHADAQGRFVHVADGHSGKSPDTSARCDVLAALTACASQQGAPLLFLPLSRSAPRRSVAASPSASGPPFLAQGPPVLL